MNYARRDPIGPPAERWNWVDEFVRGINRLAPPEKQTVRWTAQEWANLHFLYWLRENGRLPS